MEATQKILIGSHARYSGTGSTGEIIDVKTDEKGTWAKIDTTELWYNTRFIEVINENEYQRLKKEKNELKTEEKVKKEVSFKKKLNEIDMSSELCDGGG